MWLDSSKTELAAQALRITAKDLTEMGCVDGIVPEPAGGAHLDHEAAAALLDASLQKHLAELKKQPLKELVTSRYNKFRNMAQRSEEHTSELQSPDHLVCRLLLEKKKTPIQNTAE